MNDYSCDSILLHSPDPAGSLKGPTPGTDPDTKTGLDVLQTQMMLRGSAVAVVPVAVGLGMGWWLGSRRPPQDRESVHKRRPSAVATPAYGVAVVGAIVGSILGATWLLNDPVAMLPLAISLAAPLVALTIRSAGIWVVWVATVFQAWFAVTVAVPVGFLFLPSAAAMLVGAVADSLPHSKPSAETGSAPTPN